MNVILTINLDYYSDRARFQMLIRNFTNIK